VCGRRGLSAGGAGGGGWRDAGGTGAVSGLGQSSWPQSTLPERCHPLRTGTASISNEPDAFPFAAIAMALNAALSTVIVSVPALRRLLRATAGVP
jgi:hypothetical protein